MNPQALEQELANLVKRIEETAKKLKALKAMKLNIERAVKAAKNLG